jgi:hypothetical protein
MPFGRYHGQSAQNGDRRGMMLDGEASFVLSSLPAALAVTDFFSIMARSVAVETPEELNALLPPTTGWTQRRSRRIRFVL